DHSTRLIKFIEDNFMDEKSKMYFSDVGIEGSKFWKDSWIEKNKIICDFFKVKDFKEIVLDPKNFCYSQGIKLTTINYEIVKKLMRNRTQDHVDFVMINSIYPD